MAPITGAAPSREDGEVVQAGSPEEARVAGRVRRAAQEFDPFSVGKVLVIIAVLALLPIWMPTFWLSLCSLTAVYSVAILSVVLLYRATGAISLCQATFMGIAAYACAFLATGHMSLTEAMVVGVCIAVAIGVALSIPALRLQGLELSILTITVALAANAVVFNANAPLSISPTTQTASLPAGAVPFGISVTTGAEMYWMMLVIAAVLFGIVAFILRSRIGETWQAIRSGQWAASVSGIFATRYRILAFALSAALAAASGVMLLLLQHSVTAASFDIPESVTLVVFAMFVGMESLGAAVAAGGIVATGSQILQAFNLSGELVLTIVGFLTIAAIVARANRAQRTATLA
jgi:ABC-type branched-subunit amino acid transport system permease subunit